jgi:hypothetical protein
LSMPMAYATRHIENVHPENPDSVDVYYIWTTKICEVDTEIITTTTYTISEEVYDYTGSSDGWNSLTVTWSYSETQSEINHETDVSVSCQMYELRVGESMDFEDDTQVEYQFLPSDEEYTIEYGDVSNPDYGYWISITVEVTFSGTGSSRITSTTYT